MYIEGKSCELGYEVSTIQYKKIQYPTINWKLDRVKREGKCIVLDDLLILGP